MYDARLCEVILGVVRTMMTMHSLTHSLTTCWHHYHPRHQAMKICHKAMLAKRRRGQGKALLLRVVYASAYLGRCVGPAGNALDHIWREVEILRRLSHPNVVALKHVINDPQSSYLYIGTCIRCPSTWRSGLRLCRVPSCHALLLTPSTPSF
jgi:serine/threonine protein kinase